MTRNKVFPLGWSISPGSLCDRKVSHCWQQSAELLLHCLRVGFTGRRDGRKWFSKHVTPLSAAAPTTGLSLLEDISYQQLIRDRAGSSPGRAFSQGNFSPAHGLSQKRIKKKASGPNTQIHHSCSVTGSLCRPHTGQQWGYRHVQGSWERRNNAPAGQNAKWCCRDRASPNKDAKWSTYKAQPLC